MSKKSYQYLMGCSERYPYLCTTPWVERGHYTFISPGMVKEDLPAAPFIRVPIPGRGLVYWGFSLDMDRQEFSRLYPNVSFTSYAEILQ